MDQASWEQVRAAWEQLRVLQWQLFVTALASIAAVVTLVYLYASNKTTRDAIYAFQKMAEAMEKSAAAAETSSQASRIAILEAHAKARPLLRISGMSPILAGNGWKFDVGNFGAPIRKLKWVLRSSDPTMNKCDGQRDAHFPATTRFQIEVTYNADLARNIVTHQIRFQLDFRMEDEIGNFYAQTAEFVGGDYKTINDPIKVDNFE